MKVLFATLLSILCLSIFAAPVGNPTATGKVASKVSKGSSSSGDASVQSASCTVEFYSGDSAVKTVTLSYSNPKALVNSFASNNKNIDSFQAYGTRCVLNVFVFQYTNQKGNNLGTWVTYAYYELDLTYNDFYDQSKKKFINWGDAVSSAAVYFY